MEDKAPLRRYLMRRFAEVAEEHDQPLPGRGVTNWRKRASSKGAWKDMLRQAKIR